MKSAFVVPTFSWTHLFFSACHDVSQSTSSFSIFSCSSLWHRVSFSANGGPTPTFAQVHACPGIDLLGRYHHLQQSWKTLLDKSGPGLSPGQHSPRDTWGWSPEISSNPNWCNLSPGPGIVSWTESPSMSCLVTCRHNGTIAPESLSWQEEIWHWFGFHARGMTADKLFWGGTAFWFFRLRLHPFSKWSHFTAVVDVFLRVTFLLVVRDASLWFLRDLTPIGQQGCVPVANVLFWCPDGVGV